MNLKLMRGEKKKKWKEKIWKKKKKREKEEKERKKTEKREKGVYKLCFEAQD